MFNRPYDDRRDRCTIVGDLHRGTRLVLQCVELDFIKVSRLYRSASRKQPASSGRI